ncbi:mitochondrial 54S ribosomal protein YmL6 [Sugiyamaella lignohabitans]|uniref:Large ribosomal subunit protein uL4m n=1 Tax=Sugiyamaella lignohabitans TaxID=796027 RepID=A0A161HJX4_9ASCO|nr:mitochondrial 54S ribosomal protein YmL6 [Sugiyamaella lignohabitans]ANB13127.1 mitochondrial 54S ribosomal protein YmL6 [Sugiyamaella lignohabitans]
MSMRTWGQNLLKAVTNNAVSSLTSKRFINIAARKATPANYVLATYRAFPSLEPIRFQPVSKDLLGLPVRRDILWQAAVYERDAARVGSREILGRGDMGYSKKKLLPQKGSGKARQGDRGSPIRHDGGRAFGRAPGHDYSTELPKQVYAKAIRTALSYQYQQGHLLIVDDVADFVTGHENAGKLFMSEHGLVGKSVTFIVDNFRNNLNDATVKQRRVEIVSKEGVTVQDILKPQRLIIESRALMYLAQEYQPVSALNAISPKPIETAA